MPLTPGTRFGSYEIAEPIGAGGMGEVYRARDSKLERDVAIKVLPPSFSQDADRIARFEQEAKTLASLNHTNIAQVFGLEQADGNTAIVMELIEGPTLAERIEQGPIPADEALNIAMQIANALEAAHGQHIVHRDLKPANIKLKLDGTVKVLDFGIAKALAPELAGAQSPIMTTPVTQVGVILGTAAYMSPEQARGKPVDKRTDIWAFGCVLYEMLTGQLAFGGEDVAVIMARVIANDTNMDSLPAMISPAVRHTIKLCLQKDPNKRIRDIGDVKLALEGTFETAIERAGEGAAETRPSWRQALPFATAALIVGGLLAGFVAWNVKPEPVPASRPVVRGVYALPDGIQFRGMARPALSISPDGRRFVFNALGSLYLHSLDSFQTTLIPGTEMPGVSPEFSPDGEALLYWQSGQLRRFAVAGGASLGLASMPGPPLGIRWETDGTILYDADDGIWQVAENGGEPELVVPVEGGLVLSPQRLPGGDWILYTHSQVDSQARFRLEDSEITVASPSLGERRVVRRGAVETRYLSTGHLVYAFEGVLYAVPFDVDRLEETGSPVPIVEGIRTGVTGVAQFDVSDTGVLIYIPGPVSSTAADFSLATADRDGNMAFIGDMSGPYERVRASPDGRRVAIDSMDENESSIWIYDLDGLSAVRRLTFDGNNAYAVWSPDNERIAFQSTRGGDAGIWAQRIDGAGGAERLTTATEGERHTPESWSPDGQHLAFSVEKEGWAELWVLSLEDGQVARFGNVESLEPIGSTFSPDGNWIAYHSVPRGSNSLATNSGTFIEPFPATGARYQLPKVERDFQPVWSRDAMVLYYLGATASGQLAAVNVSTESGVSFGSPTSFPFVLTAGRLSGATRGFDVLPDGRFIGLTSGPDTGGDSDPSEIRFVLNWFEELKRLVPTE